MGQCSTLPAEARTSSSAASVRFDGVFHHSSNNTSSNDFRQEQRHRLRDDGRKESLDFNALIPEQLTNSQMKGAPMQRAFDSKREPDQLQTRDPEAYEENGDPEPMEVDSREEAPIIISIPPPPENAVRTRCYKLNLDSKALGLSSTQKQTMWLGPFSEPPPQLTYSLSEDSSQGVSPTSVAIKTAQIFRGITVSRDGTILSQNARATRSNRGNKTKKGEKSRQAAKIDKAKDLVEENILTGKAPDSDEPANMVSLVIVGEYDDMKHLVRDGSKKLREASELPDEALVTLNRPRANSVARSKAAAAMAAVVTSSSNASKKRISPTFVNSQRTAAQVSPGKVQIQAQPVDSDSSFMQQQQQQQQAQQLQSTQHPQPLQQQGQTPSSPPKLKVHPRDNRPGRREDRAGLRMRLESCQPGAAGDGDWSHAWNLWNCGGTGTVSPLQPSSPKDANHSKVMYEGRDSMHVGVREAGVTNRTS